MRRRIKRITLISAILIIAVIGGLLGIYFFTGSRNTISYTGSSTIGENIIPEAFRVFSEETGVRAGTIETPGSGKGVQEVINGEAPFAGLSRPLFKQEKRVLYQETIGYDAIVVFVNRNNPVDNLSKEQLKEIFTGNIRNWKTVDGNESSIVVVTEIIGEKRATAIEFQNLVMDGEPYLSNRIEVDTPAEQVSVLETDEHAIIAVSLAFAAPGIKALSVNHVLPTKSNIRTEDYLITRPLILVSKGKPKGITKDFFNFMISPKGQNIVEKKFVPLGREK